MPERNTVLIIAGAVLLVLNILSFSLMAIDKRRAAKGAWRIPEKTLFLSAACFGGLGGVLGMFLCRHKTKHWYFRYGLPAILILQIAAAVLILTR